VLDQNEADRYARCDAAGLEREYEKYRDEVRELLRP
jgi:hypothetical protein